MIPRWIIDKRWVVYANDQDAALQKFWSYYPDVLGDFSESTEDVAREIIQDGFYTGIRTESEVRLDIPIDLRSQLQWGPTKS